MKSKGALEEILPECLFFTINRKEKLLMTKGIPELYGSLVFNNRVMRDKLPKDIYRALRKTIENNTHLELDVANSLF